MLAEKVGFLDDNQAGFRRGRSTANVFGRQYWEAVGT